MPRGLSGIEPNRSGLPPSRNLIFWARLTVRHQGSPPAAAPKTPGAAAQHGGRCNGGLSCFSWSDYFANFHGADIWQCSCGDCPAPTMTGATVGNYQSVSATTRRSSAYLFTAIIYFAAFTTGAIVMSFEMLGSRYLNPFFGSSIYTWAALISTVLAALTVGYFLGGFIADRTVSAAVLGAVIAGASIYLLALPSFAESILSFVFDKIDDTRLGSLYSAFAIMFLPVTLFGVYSPFAIRLVLNTAQRSGTCRAPSTACPPPVRSWARSGQRSFSSL